MVVGGTGSSSRNIFSHGMTLVKHLKVELWSCCHLYRIAGLVMAITRDVRLVRRGRARATWLINGLSALAPHQIVSYYQII